MRQNPRLGAPRRTRCRMGCSDPSSHGCLPQRLERIFGSFQRDLMYPEMFSGQFLDLHDQGYQEQAFSRLLKLKALCTGHKSTASPAQAAAQNFSPRCVSRQQHSTPEHLCLVRQTWKDGSLVCVTSEGTLQEEPESCATRACVSRVTPTSGVAAPRAEPLPSAAVAPPELLQRPLPPGPFARSG